MLYIQKAIAQRTPYWIKNTVENFNLVIILTDRRFLSSMRSLVFLICCFSNARHFHLWNQSLPVCMIIRFRVHRLAKLKHTHVTCSRMCPETNLIKCCVCNLQLTAHAARGPSGLIVLTRAEAACSTARETVYHPSTRKTCHARTIRKKADYVAQSHVRVS